MIDSNQAVNCKFRGSAHDYMVHKTKNYLFLFHMMFGGNLGEERRCNHIFRYNQKMMPRCIYNVQKMTGFSLLAHLEQP